MTYRVRNLLIAVGLSLVAALLTLLYVTNYKRSVQHGTATVRVYVAAHDIPAGTTGSNVVNGHDLRAESVQRREVVPGALSSPKQIDSMLVTDPIYAGEQVTMRHFGALQAEGIRGTLKGTERAVQVAGDPDQLLAGTLKSGDHVDLVANLHATGSMQSAADRIVLRNLTILTPPDTSTTAKLSTSGNGQTFAIIEVTDTQVQRLFYVLQNADWALELRPALGAKDSTERIETADRILTEGVPK
jgi:Flp pilus assembly protein CpaB